MANLIYITFLTNPILEYYFQGWLTYFQNLVDYYVKKSAQATR